MSPQPLEIREDVPSRASKAEAAGIWCNSEERVQQGIVLANAVEAGRYYPNQSDTCIFTFSKTVLGKDLKI